MTSKLDRGDYLFAAWSGLLEEIRREALAAVEGQPTGVGRIRMAIEALLDGSLRRRSIHELAVSLAASPRREAITDRHLGAALALLHLELQRAGVPNPQERALLVCERVCDLAREEFDARGPLADSRRTLYGWLEGLRP